MNLLRRTFFAQMFLAGLANLISAQRARAETVSYTYDDLGRLVRAEYSNGTIITYTYDAAGNRTAARTDGAPLAPQCTLFANPASIAYGASSQLTWTSANATGAAIDQGVDAVTPVAGGSISVSPTTTKTYTLTVTGPGGQASAQASVAVGPPPAPTCTLAANPSSIIPGQSSTLAWTSTTATSASIDNGVGAVTPVAGGSRSVSPAATTTYTLTAVGPGGQATAQAVVTVTPLFSATIPITGTGPVNLRSLADAAGYNGAQAANIVFTLAGGVTLAGAPGAPAGGVAIDTGTWPHTQYSIDLELRISGEVRGGGGRGGGGSGGGAGGAGGSGGDAVHCRAPIDIIVNSGGVVRSGGGGGGGGGARQVQPPPEPLWRGGGGGGGGAPNGSGGSGGAGDLGTGASGSPGTASGGGAGGAGNNGAGNGGAGGNFGIPGVAGVSSTGAGGAGGGAGYAIRKNGHAVAVTNNGAITGTVS